AGFHSSPPSGQLPQPAPRPGRRNRPKVALCALAAGAWRCRKSSDSRRVAQGSGEWAYLPQNLARQTLSEWHTVRKQVRRGFPHMLVGYMRVSTDGDRQVLDLQRDALL